MKDSSAFPECPRLADELFGYEEVTVQLPLAVLAFIDMMIEGTDASRADGAAFLIRSEFHRFLIGSKLDTVGFADDVRVLDITPFSPVSAAEVEPAMAYIEHLAVTKEANV